MSIKVESFQTSTGWYCPGCGSYHSPDTKTCPVTPNPVQPYTPWTPYPSRPPSAPEVPWPYDPFQQVSSHCVKCGIELSNLMMYVCVNPGCPTGLGGPVCLTEVNNEYPGC